MQKITLLLLVLFVSSTAVALAKCYDPSVVCDNPKVDHERKDDTFDKSRRDFRLVSYNVRHCAGADLPIDYDKTANIIIDLDADFVSLQELDSVNLRSEGVDQLAMLAERTGMYHFFSKSIDHAGGKYGNGILSKLKPMSTKSVALPGGEPRSIAVAEFDDFVIISTHLCLEEVNRVESIPIITAIAKGYGKTVFLAGDLNEEDLDGEMFSQLKKDWEIVSLLEATYPAQGPTNIIDYILVLRGEHSRITKCDVVDRLVGNDIATSSDHIPIFCDFKRN